MNNAFINDFDDNTKTYFKEIKDYRSFSKLEERKLWGQVKKSNESARNQLITSNLKFVVSIAKSYKGRGIPFPELVSEGNIGLMKAIDKFDYTRDVKFISYAVHWIKQSIRESIKKKTNNEELPNEYSKELCEFDDNYCSDDDNYLLDITQHSVNQENNVLDGDEYQMVQELLKTLSEREAVIIKTYFGMGNNDVETLEEIGIKYNLTKERIRQIKEKALTKLRSNALVLEKKYYIER